MDVSIWSKQELYYPEPLEWKKTLLVLIDVIDYLSRKWYNYWISAWTALWIYRDNQLIPWDTDIDFGVLWGQDIELPEKYELFQTQYVWDKPMQKAYLIDWIVIDFYFYYESWDKLICNTTVWDIVKTKNYIDWILPVMPEYLIERYWDNWNIPKYKKDNWTSDCKNLVQW